HLAATDFQVQGEDAAAGLDGQRRFAGDAVVVEVFPHTADAVAAHLRFTAISVEHAHAGVGLVGGANEDEAVSANAEMTVADSPAQPCGVVWHRVAEAIDIDVVVAAAL